MPQASHETTPFLPQVSSREKEEDLLLQISRSSHLTGGLTGPSPIISMTWPVNHQDQASNRKFAHRSRPFHLSHCSNIPLPWNPGEGGTPPHCLGLWPSPLSQYCSSVGLLLPLRPQQLLQPTQAWPHLHSQCAHCLITWHPGTFHHLRSISRPPRDMGGL